MKFLKFIFKMILTIVIAAILGCAAIVGYSVYEMNQEKTEREEIADSGEESTEITATPVISEGSAEESMENSAGDSTTVETVSDDVIREDFKKCWMIMRNLWTNT
ncbi:MAG: hypothetical protein LUG26_04055 [Ruminococcus sp.]|nr:hypothetical protein [Ruminococcus sp.]